jgi:hypothetical protein
LCQYLYARQLKSQTSAVVGHKSQRHGLDQSSGWELV